VVGSREAVYEDHRATEIAAALALTGAATTTNAVDVADTDITPTAKVPII
jgi:hypothetical protein